MLKEIPLGSKQNVPSFKPATETPERP
ncbi:hypothetical protein JMJ77_0015426 [Colletotrichum scovillei]|uniref:Uncharacterized protein n=1 Tax=Colletotrichum scovillei TaxID=1209932 RepID=A0A9P7UFX6_9PEZI|nr:hypothetical protein JMJ77_0015426 [Colletotrichum scovillei]KAG7057062.1 hypothetical protein JMJ78_0000846 [Colletotrichum scovillei]KAG7066980.1 hypothetical protein JMJ76_0000825 [Colletotrichum scovillei]